MVIQLLETVLVYRSHVIFIKLFGYCISNRIILLLYIYSSNVRWDNRLNLTTGCLLAQSAFSVHLYTASINKRVSRLIYSIASLNL
jgi:hypothetical protein